ncbi:F-box/FBD/LRR-repeat protein [Raphanus sativus]|nr:F-box/FBD/LRR-repeat protein [Raphanus sativus]
MEKRFYKSQRRDVSLYEPCLGRVDMRKMERYQVENRFEQLSVDNIATPPLTLSACEALVCLKLHFVRLNEFVSLSLPCLKTMYLEDVVMPSDAAAEALISSSPVLEVLKISVSVDDAVVALRVCSKSLKSFALKGVERFYVRGRYSVLIDAPKLEHLSLMDYYHFKSFKIISAADSFKVEIDVEFVLMRGYLSETKMIYNLVKSFSGVEDMTISWTSLKELVIDDSTDPVSIRISTVLPSCLVSSLESVEIESPVTEKAIELKLARYFMKNSTTLKKLVLRLNDCTLEPCVLEQLVEKSRRYGLSQFEVIPVVPTPNPWPEGREDFVVALRVCSLSLKSFTLKRVEPIYPRGHSVLIDAPKLEYLSLMDFYHFRSFEIISKAESFKVDIDVEFEPMTDYLSEQKIIDNLLNNFSGVKDMTMSWRTLKELFVNYPIRWRSELSTVLPRCLVSSLESVEMESPVTEIATELDLARYFMKNSTTLKKLVLHLDESTGDQHKPGVLEQLVKFSKRYSLCLFEVLPVVPAPNPLPPGYVYVKSNSRDDFVVALRVCSPSLNSFTLKRVNPIYARGHSVVIDAPKLEYLSLMDYYHFRSFEIISKAESFKVDIDVEFELMTDYLSEQKIIDNLLNSFSGVKVMTISWKTLQFIHSSPQTNFLPKFHGLTRLRVSMCLNASPQLLPIVLESCPNLKHLTLELLIHYPEVIARLSTVLPRCLVSSLVSVEMDSPVTEIATELDLSRYFMKNSTTLKKVVLRLNQSSTGEKHKPGVLEQLIESPRRSALCQFEVIPVVTISESSIA